MPYSDHRALVWELMVGYNCRRVTLYTVICTPLEAGLCYTKRIASDLVTCFSCWYVDSLLPALCREQPESSVICLLKTLLFLGYFPSRLPFREIIHLGEYISRGILFSYCTRTDCAVSTRSSVQVLLSESVKSFAKDSPAQQSL